MPRKKLGRNVIRARELRREMSLPEVLLWRLLRRAPGGMTFRRQHPVGPYVLDFYFAPARLAIEVDGRPMISATGLSAMRSDRGG